MSHVTDVILLNELNDGEPLTDTKEWLKAHYNGCSLYRVDGRRVGGDKVMQSDIYMGAFNYMDIRGFIDYLELLDWDKDGGSRECFQLLIKKEHDVTFALWRFEGLKLKEQIKAEVL